MLGREFSQPPQSNNPIPQGEPSVATSRFSPEILKRGDPILEAMRVWDINRLGFVSCQYKALSSLGLEYKKLPKKLREFLMYKQKEYEEAQRQASPVHTGKTSPSTTPNDIRLAEEEWLRQHRYDVDAVNRLPEEERDAYLISMEAEQQDASARKAFRAQERNTQKGDLPEVK